MGRLKLSLQELIFKFTKGDRLVFGNATSITKFGIRCMPEAVKLFEYPFAVSFRYIARPMSIDVMLAPVSKCAITRRDNRGSGTAFFRSHVAVDISTGRLKPKPNNLADETPIPNFTPCGGGGLMFNWKEWW